MSNDPKADLIYAILSMDSYNRGYGFGITDKVISQSGFPIFSVTYKSPENYRFAYDGLFLQMREGVRMSIEIGQLRCAVMAAEMMSSTKAAQKLNIKQSTLSKSSGA